MTLKMYASRPDEAPPHTLALELKCDGDHGLFGGLAMAIEIGPATKLRRGPPCCGRRRLALHGTRRDLRPVLQKMSTMTEWEFRSRIKDGRAFKDELEEAFRDAFRSIGWHDAAGVMGVTFDGLIDEGDGDPYVTQYENAGAALGAIEKALQGEDSAERKIEVIEKIINEWEGE